MTCVTCEVYLWPVTNYAANAATIPSSTPYEQAPCVCVCVFTDEQNKDRLRQNTPSKHTTHIQTKCSNENNDRYVHVHYQSITSIIVCHLKMTISFVQYVAFK